MKKYEETKEYYKKLKRDEEIGYMSLFDQIECDEFKQKMDDESALHLFMKNFNPLETPIGEWDEDFRSKLELLPEDYLRMLRKIIVLTFGEIKWREK